MCDNLTIVSRFLNLLLSTTILLIMNFSIRFAKRLAKSKVHTIVWGSDALLTPATIAKAVTEPSIPPYTKSDK